MSGGTRISSFAWRWFCSATAGVAALVYPPECIRCAGPTSFGEVVCSACAVGLPAPASPACARCGEPLDDARIDLCLRCGTTIRAFDGVVSVGPYRGAWGDLVRAFKFDGERAVGRWLARRIVQRVRECGWSCALSCVTHVPMTAREERARGFNPARTLSREVARGVRRPARTLLSKSRTTPPQRTLPARERATNLSGAFEAVRWGSGSVLLVDDLLTTGATADECARTLKRAGFEKVYIATVARA